MTNNEDTTEETTDHKALLLKLLETMETPESSEPNVYRSEADAYLEKIRAQRQAARERLGITDEFSFKEQGD